MRYIALVLALLGGALLVSPSSAGSFSDWAAIVVAGDWHSHSGAPSEVFDSGRRDVSANLVKMGFTPGNILQFSVRPERYPGTDRSDKQTIANELWDLSNRTTGGCFIYVTSHGSPDGAVLGEGVLSPSALGGMLDNACGSRPTIVFVVACFSGVFVGPLDAPNRFVMTAARPDRPSFGCGDNDRYTFFDNCWLDSVGGVGDFLNLANAIRACVSRKETEIHALPSEPQLTIGTQLNRAILSWR